MPKIIWRRVPRTLLWLLLNPHIMLTIIFSAIASVICTFLFWMGEKLDAAARCIRKWNIDPDNKLLRWPTFFDELIDWFKVKK
ncbi:hypothetical protein I5455_10580 [Citrobacter koseri]|uniref:hypothetical protein n=1 Tax=Citrobacter koseri TaxID=545 RepID=UPI0019019A46|nr:hypothetical protein [Citrobacter koseri]MBJ9102968.1 hypothetical protein [Citrobacter koseri]